MRCHDLGRRSTPSRAAPAPAGGPGWPTTRGCAGCAPRCSAGPPGSRPARRRGPYRPVVLETGPASASRTLDLRPPVVDGTGILDVEVGVVGADRVTRRGRRRPRPRSSLDDGRGHARLELAGRRAVVAAHPRQPGPARRPGACTTGAARPSRRRHRRRHRGDRAPGRVPAPGQRLARRSARPAGRRWPCSSTASRSSCAARCGPPGTSAPSRGGRARVQPRAGRRAPPSTSPTPSTTAATSSACWCGRT